MPKIMSVEELNQLRERVRKGLMLREQGEHVEEMTVIRVGISEDEMNEASQELIQYFVEEIAVRNLEEVMVVLGACLEPIELQPVITLQRPHEEDRVFHKVTKEEAQSIVIHYILGENDQQDSESSLSVEKE